jgi:hypothetical protein
MWRAMLHCKISFSKYLAGLLQNLHYKYYSQFNNLKSALLRLKVTLWMFEPESGLFDVFKNYLGKNTDTIMKEKNNLCLSS